MQITHVRTLIGRDPGAIEDIWKFLAN